MQRTSILVAVTVALGAAGAAFAGGGDGGHKGHRDHVHTRHFIRHHGVETAAMHNIMAELISAKTGKSVGEVQTVFEQQDPHEALDTLGVSRDEARALRKQAREQLVARAQAAGLITAAQAEKIRAQPERMVRMPRPPAAPDAPEPPLPPELD